MIYTFTTAAFGDCQLVRNTSGKRGFSAPKLFTVSAVASTAGPLARQRTYRFIDKQIAGIVPVQLHDHTLARIAIAQFLIDSGSALSAPLEQLDTSIAPYAGSVVNHRGREIKPASVPALYVRPHMPASSTPQDDIAANCCT